MSVSNNTNKGVVVPPGMRLDYVGRPAVERQAHVVSVARDFARGIVAFRSELLAGELPEDLADDLTRQWIQDLLSIDDQWGDED